MGEDEPFETDQRDSISVKQQSPAGIFKALANETRIEILEILGDPPGKPKSFSEIYDTVSIGDSGNFAYHLEELLGTFVRENGDKYVLSNAGEQVFGSVQAGTYSANATVEATAFGGHCQLCGGELLFNYADERAQVYCDECGKGRSFPFPPRHLPEYDIDELPAVSASWYRTRVKRVLDGFCPVCAGQVEGELLHGVKPTGSPSEPSMAAFTCENCGKQVQLSGATIATFHPIFEGFLFEHGFDTREDPHSEVWAALDETSERTHTHDPLSIEVTFTNNDEQVTGLIDAEASVTDVERQQVQRNR